MNDIINRVLNITAAQYTAEALDSVLENTGVIATIDGQEMYVPLDPDNRHYAEILRQVEEGTLVIQEADVTNE